jgi:hypothetical protein
LSVGEEAGGAETLVGRLGAIVDAMGAGALPSLGHELFHGLEEVHVQAGELVDALELPIGGPGGEAIIADELPADGHASSSTQTVAMSTAQRVQR